jgi:hypothetical protein
MLINYELIDEADRSLILSFIRELQSEEDHRNPALQKLKTYEEMFPLPHQVQSDQNTLLNLFGDLLGSPNPVGSFSKRRR